MQKLALGARRPWDPALQHRELQPGPVFGIYHGRPSEVKKKKEEEPKNE